MIQEIDNYMSPEKEAYIHQLITKTKETGHQVFIQNGDPEYMPTQQQKKSECYRKEFDLDAKKLGETVLHLLDIIPDYRYFPTLFGNDSEDWYKVVYFDISIVDTDNNVWVWIGISHADRTNETEAFLEVPDEDILKEILNRPLYQTLRSQNGYIRGRAYSIELRLIEHLGKDSITIEDLCNNFTQIYYVRGIGKYIGDEIYKYLVNGLGIPENKIRR